MTPAPNDRERARHAFDAAGAGYDLERLLLSLGESLRRGEAPDAVVAAGIPGARDRLNASVALAIGER